MTKQPAEIESYAVVYDDDLNENEDIQSAYIALVNTQTYAGKHVVTANHDVEAGENGYLFLVPGNVTLTIPALADLTELFVANSETSNLATVSSSELIDGQGVKSLSSMECIALLKVNGSWFTQASAEAILSITTEQRVRSFVSGGADGSTYKLEVTTTTNEGRVLQDEIIVKIKES
jgi:hypothetical protein